MQFRMDTELKAEHSPNTPTLPSANLKAEHSHAQWGPSMRTLVDCLLAAYNRQLGDKVVSLDRKLNRLLK